MMNPSPPPNYQRRDFLRSSLWALPMPWLLAQMEAQENLQTRVSTGFVFLPNGVIRKGWGPHRTIPVNKKATLEWGPTTQVLNAYKDFCTRIEGTAMDAAKAYADGAGDHARSAATFLTAHRASKTDTPPLNVGISIDQVIAQQLGQNYRIPALNLSTQVASQSGSCDSGYHCSYSEHISWKDQHTPSANLVNPEEVFKRIFGVHANKSKAELEALWDKKKSLLDTLLTELKRFKQRGGAEDQALLDDYTTSIRELERQLQVERKSEHVQVKLELPPEGFQSKSEHRRMLLKLMSLTFRHDLSPVSTMMMGQGGSNTVYRELEIQEGHHSLSHHGGDVHKMAQLQKIDQLMMADMAYLCSELQRDLSPTWQGLRQCQIMVGSCIDDGQQHNHHDLPILVLGTAGGKFKGAQHHRFAEKTPLANLYVNMLQNTGIAQANFGDATGPFGGLS
jgi:hypothetical protein